MRRAPLQIFSMSILKNSSTDRMVSEAAPVESQAHNEKADPGFIYGTYDPVVITI